MSTPRWWVVKVRRTVMPSRIATFIEATFVERIFAYSSSIPSVENAQSRHPAAASTAYP
ncbi:hypothetical protein Mlaev_01924 [Microbacterium laevaniformans]|uniref:Uncharacterized protein n=1 Tax=Microbacterium laevaniformans TaxID=36807 RepID=A0A150HDK1_9MICO|nr:hypothetical protein Mlaev_01924 [Microbacterium laevaniformans]